MTSPQSAVLTILRDCGGHAAEIATITRDAFRARYGSGESEAAILAGLRKDGDVIAELAAIGDGQLVGHAMLSGMTVTPPLCRIAALGPVCARVDRQGAGIGTALIRAGLVACVEQGIAAVFVLGDPSYYRRFGFSAAKASAVACAYSGPHLQALELTPRVLDGVKSVAYAPAFSAV